MYSFSKSLILSVVTSLDEKAGFLFQPIDYRFPDGIEFSLLEWGVIPNEYSCGTRSAAIPKLMNAKKCSKIHADTIRTIFTNASLDVLVKYHHHIRRRAIAASHYKKKAHGLR